MTTPEHPHHFTVYTREFRATKPAAIPTIKQPLSQKQPALISYSVAITGGIEGSPTECDWNSGKKYCRAVYFECPLEDDRLSGIFDRTTCTDGAGKFSLFEPWFSIHVEGLIAS
jgi:hypothetical protein